MHSPPGLDLNRLKSIESAHQPKFWMKCVWTNNVFIWLNINWISKMCKMILWRWCCLLGLWEWGEMGGEWIDCICMEGVHSNTSVVHMHYQRFSKHTLIEICPFEGKNKTSKKKKKKTHPWTINNYIKHFCTVSHPILPHKQDFLLLKMPSNRIKKDPFSWKGMHSLIPNHDPYEFCSV